MSLDRQKYYEAAKRQLEPGIFKHSLALESCMGGLYDYFYSNNLLYPDEPARDDWTLAGLIHDIDFSGEFKDQHPAKTREALSLYGLEVSDIVYNIVQAHAVGAASTNLKNKAKWSIFCADSLTGLIMAVAYVYPNKKLADVKVSSVLKRFLKEPRFAAGTRRNEVAMCSDLKGLDLPLEKFVEICLTSMQAIANELGL
jgi:predicted hydrolase (HD superfamily)